MVSSGAHYWSTFDQQVRESPEPLKTLGSKECRTAQYVIYLSTSTFSLIRDRASFDRYCDTKRNYHFFLCQSTTYGVAVINVLFVRALANRLANIPVIVNAVDPGYSHSELDRHAQGFAGMVVFLVKLILAMSAEQGSRQLVWGALGGKEDEENLRGAYISHSHITEPSDFVLSRQGQNLQEKIWVCMYFMWHMHI